MLKAQNQSNEAFKQMYKSAIHASYFAHFQDANFAKKSKIQLQSIDQKDKEQIDQKTFRIMTNFIRPTIIILYKNTGKCYLEADSIFSCFSKRRVYDICLINSKLSIKNNDRVSRFVDFSAVSAKVTAKGDGFIITFQGSPAELYIQSASKDKSDENKKWVKMLNDVISNCDGAKKKLTYLAEKNPLDFYKTEHVTDEQFAKCANSGDIILFKSQHSAAAAQRLFTDSQYDHVGIILRNKKNQLYIFQSASDTGVGFTPWKHMIKYQWYQQTDKICWRPLMMTLTDRDIHVIEGFTAKTLGKQFSLDIQKLFTFKSSLKRSDEQEQKKTYFCSELVARLYKQLGILDEQKASTTYYPVNFTDGGQLKIIRKDVSLGNQRLIAFDKM